jgi:ketosteroid isomerase-like protein
VDTARPPQVAHTSVFFQHHSLRRGLRSTKGANRSLRVERMRCDRRRLLDSIDECHTSPRRRHQCTRECPDREGCIAAIGRGDIRGLRAFSAEDIERIVLGEGWPLAGARRGHAGLADLLQTESETVESSFFEARKFVAQGDRVLVVGFTRGKIIATNKTFEDNWIFAITVRNGKLTNVREYIDTQALARASEMDA